jgi:hypothetical protein
MHVPVPTVGALHISEQPKYWRSITLLADHGGRAVFVSSNTWIVGSNLTQGMDVCVYSVFVLDSGLATG